MSQIKVCYFVSTVPTIRLFLYQFAQLVYLLVIFICKCQNDPFGMNEKS